MLHMSPGLTHIPHIKLRILTLSQLLQDTVVCHRQWKVETKAPAMLELQQLQGMDCMNGVHMILADELHLKLLRRLKKKCLERFMSTCLNGETLQISNLANSMAIKIETESRCSVHYLLNQLWPFSDATMKSNHPQTLICPFFWLCLWTSQ